jgi:hypothetical protein
MFLTTKGGGMCIATVPDVCKVPAAPAPIPTPFPNMAQVAMANPGTCTLAVKVLNMPVLHKGSEIPMSNGDEAGVAGGLVSGTFGQKVAFQLGTMNVKVEGQPAINLMKPTGHNGASPNSPMGMNSVPGQTKVLIQG